MILASNNAHKLEEFRAIFADMGIEIIPQSAAGCHFEVDETGDLRGKRLPEGHRRDPRDRAARRRGRFRPYG